MSGKVAGPFRIGRAKEKFRDRVVNMHAPANQHGKRAAKSVEEARSFLATRFPKTAQIGLVLGSGLGAFADQIDDRIAIPYADIPNFPASKVVGHKGNLCFGRAGNIHVLCMQGRVHSYEGHPTDDVVLGVRTMAALGVKAVLVTNAAGGLHEDWSPGDFMLIEDHLNLTGQNPLVGPNDENMGPRFPDMTEAYDRRLHQAAEGAANSLNLTLRKGVYAGLLGPTYETPAEVRMLARLGADAVGMSTVLEVIALRHLGVPVGALSCITNLAAGISKTKLDHSEVEATAQARRSDLLAFLREWLARTAEVIDQ
jgi:purine-nucleoside phosphorylase